MKMLLATAALAAAIASPALAQTRVTVPYQYGYDNGSYGPVQPAAPRARSANRSYDVYDTRGNYVGSDPDPVIRDDLARTRGH